MQLVAESCAVTFLSDQTLDSTLVDDKMDKPEYHRYLRVGSFFM